MLNKLNKKNSQYKISDRYNEDMPIITNYQKKTNQNTDFTYFITIRISLTKE